MTKTTTQTPFGFLTAEQLRGLAAFFAADSAAVSVEVEHDGITATVTPRDLRFIHSIEAGRFGTVAECPYCQPAELGDDEAAEMVALLAGEVL